MIDFTLPGDGDATRVLVGPLADCAPLAALADRRPVIVSEPHAWGLHGARLPFSIDPLLVAEGEAAKSWDGLAALIDGFAERGVDRDTPVIAFGGGAVGDLAGLAASLYQRGCPVVQVPTTLLAQADSALGGKTAIDAAGRKNLVGTFHPPALVVADPSLLATLDLRQRRAGYAEIVKYGLIGDAPFFDWCEDHADALLAADVASATHAVATALRAKAHYVDGDLTDRTGRRALLNFGHSFGHAVEQVAGIGTLLHGEAVALGMTLAARFAAPAAVADRIANHLASIGLPTRLRDVGLSGHADALFEAMRGDKKNAGGLLRLVLIDRIGEARLQTVAPDGLLDFLRSAA